MIKLINIIKETRIVPGRKEIPSQYIDVIEKLTNTFFDEVSDFYLKKPMSRTENVQDMLDQNMLDQENEEKFNNFINKHPEGTTFLTNNLDLVHSFIPAPGAPKSSYRCKITILKNYYPYPNNNMELSPNLKNSIQVQIPHVDSDGEYFTGWFTSDGKYHGDTQNFNEDGDKIEK